jgi:glycosyltransferase involved in cell wall biosynthesis
VQAFATIARQRPEWDLILMGEGPEATKLTSMVSPELRERVQFHPFLADSEKLGSIYQACDILVLPSDYEAWALVVNEAVAAGLALVTSNVVGAAHELVFSGVNGERFRKGDLADLTQQLMRVTDATQIDRYKQNSAAVLDNWRNTADPVTGLRKSLFP